MKPSVPADNPDPEPSGPLDRVTPSLILPQLGDLKAGAAAGRIYALPRSVEGGRAFGKTENQMANGPAMTTPIYDSLLRAADHGTIERQARACFRARLRR